MIEEKIRTGPSAGHPRKGPRRTGALARDTGKNLETQQRCQPVVPGRLEGASSGRPAEVRPGQAAGGRRGLCRVVAPGGLVDSSLSLLVGDVEDFALDAELECPEDRE